mgnify:FL=1
MKKHYQNILFEKLNQFIKKYYLNQLMKGSISVLSVLLLFFILFCSLEYFSSFNVQGRTILFWSYILVSFLIIAKFIVVPALKIIKIGNTLSYKDAAKIIGKHFKEIDDKLLNILELSELSESDNELIRASIDQKTKNIESIKFKRAINLTINKKQIRWIVAPILIIILLFISGNEYILTESSARIINHNTFFEPEPPFKYVILNNDLKFIQFEDFKLKIQLTGKEIPNEVFIVKNGNKFKLKSLADNVFEFQFKHVSSDIKFQFFAGGYTSKPYLVKCLMQPKIVNLEIVVTPPKYTGKKINTINSGGDLIIFEGSSVKWNVLFNNSHQNTFVLEDKIIAESNENQLQLEKKIISNSKYAITTKNNNKLKDTLSYFIEVIKDEFPKISLSQNFDSINKTFSFTGTVGDDYGLQKLEFISEKDSSTVNSIEIDIQKKHLDNFFFVFSFDELNLNPGEKINYYFNVCDNDDVNGSKCTKSKQFYFIEPTLNDLNKRENKEIENIKSGLNQSISLAKEIENEIQELNELMLNKKELGWEEKEKAKNILNKQKELEEQIKKTQEISEQNLKTKEKLNSEILEKQKQLDELMKNVFDNEMKDLLKEMEELLQDSDKEKLKDLLEKIEDQNFDVEKELDRELELLKQLDFEQKTEEILNKIEDIKSKQQKIKEQNLKNKIKKEDLAAKQDSLNNEMNDLQKEMDVLREKNMELENKNEIPKTQNIEESIKKSMRESSENLKKSNKSKSSKAQQKAIEDLELLQQELEKMQDSSSEEHYYEDMESLRKILENLIRLSFDQEDLMHKTLSVPKNSPEFIRLVQQQKKLANNSLIIEDSLFALSKRVVQIQSIVNKEISAIRNNLQVVTDMLEQRQINKATEKQQFVMTSVNNLALLLSEIIEQMQLEMPPSNCNKPKNCNKPNPNSNKPSFSEMKKAQEKLMKKLKSGKNKGKKPGEKQSQILMQLAQQQEKIKKQLLEMRNNLSNNQDKNQLDKIIKEMEKNEKDIINNNINEETIKRQQEILTRLLEAENSEREQDQDNQREANEWKFEIDNTTLEMLEYEKQKKKQEELLKTIPLQLNPFYKKKVDSYFNRMTND